MKHISTTTTILATLSLLACGDENRFGFDPKDTFTTGEHSKLIFFYNEQRCVFNKCSLEEGHWLDFEEDAGVPLYVSVVDMERRHLPLLSFSSSAPDIFEVRSLGCGTLFCNDGSRCGPEIEANDCVTPHEYHVEIESHSVGMAQLVAYDGDDNIIDTAWVNIMPPLIPSD